MTEREYERLRGIIRRSDPVKRAHDNEVRNRRRRAKREAQKAQSA